MAPTKAQLSKHPENPSDLKERETVPTGSKPSIQKHSTPDPLKKVPSCTSVPTKLLVTKTQYKPAPKGAPALKPKSALVSTEKATLADPSDPPSVPKTKQVSKAHSEPTHKQKKRSAPSELPARPLSPVTTILQKLTNYVDPKQKILTGNKKTKQMVAVPPKP